MMWAGVAQQAEISAARTLVTKAWVGEKVRPCAGLSTIDITGLGVLAAKGFLRVKM